jgi:hypothetical protein
MDINTPEMKNKMADEFVKLVTNLEAFTKTVRENVNKPGIQDTSTAFATNATCNAVDELVKHHLTNLIR